jgi:hypothetical protein
LNEIENYPLIVTDVNGTIEEVEQILKANPELPQLSRREILEILKNITTQDKTVVLTGESVSGNDKSPVTQITSERSSDLEPGNYKTHEEYLRAMRALMLVLPYNAKNLSETKIQELYTKAPIIQFIGEHSEEDVTTITTKMKPSITSSTTTTITAEQSPNEEQHFQQQTKYPNHHEVYHQPYDSQPMHHESNYGYESETKPTTLTTEHSSTTKRFNHNHHRRRRPTTSAIKHLTTDAPEQFINQHYTTTKLSPGEKLVTTVYPERVSNYKTNQYYESGKLSTVQQAVTTVYPERVNFQEGNVSHSHITLNYNAQLQSSLQNETQYPNGLRPNPSRKRMKPPSTTATVEILSSTESTGIGLDLPTDMKNLIISFNVDDHLSNPQPAVQNTSEEVAVLITPLTAGSVPESTKFSSHYSASELEFERLTTQKPVMRDDVKELLASIGLFPEKDKQGTISTTTSTTTATPNVAAAAESLSSEMKDLLISFGLLPSANDIHQASYQESETKGPEEAYDKQAASPIVDPSSYLSFKPLPLTANENKEDEEDKFLMSSDMKQFLASFGLVSLSDSEEGYPSNVHGFRSQKALGVEAQPLTNGIGNITNQEPDHTVDNSNETMPHINIDILTDEMKNILENLGFLPPTNVSNVASKRKTSGVDSHVFNPSAHLTSLHLMKEEAQRLMKLLDTIKKLMKENGTITQDEINSLNASISLILPPVQHGNHTAQSTEDLASAVPQLFLQKEQINKSVSLQHIRDVPDPLSLDELLLAPADNKNEVKRQQLNNGTSPTTQDTGPSLTDLAASFGGGETAPDDASVDDALPPKKPNGLYFLLDWNTFLDVGEEDSSRRVNLRFNPRLGNSRDFLPVTVP